MGLLRRLGRDERGVSAVVAVVALLGIFGAATLSVDAGNLWQTRRNMVTATDASALAEASDLAFSSSTSCSGVYETMLERNAGADVYDRTCSVVRDPATGTGYVAVEGRKPVDVRFGGVIGLDDTAAYSLSAAMFGFATEARGLRPITFCNKNAHVQEWLALKEGSISQAEYDALKGAGDTNGDGTIDHPSSGSPQGSYASFGVVHRMYFTRSIDDGACGTYPGNWGWLGFNGVPAGNPELIDWLANGYDGSVRLRFDGEDPCVASPGGGDADDSAEGCVPSTPGSRAASVNPGLDAMLNDPVYILIMDQGQCVGGGVNCIVDSWAFLGVILRGYRLIGNPNGWYMDFEFIDIQVSGSCCVDLPVGADTGARAVALCAADHDSFAIDSDNRCGAVISSP